MRYRNIFYVSNLIGPGDVVDHLAGSMVGAPPVVNNLRPYAIRKSLVLVLVQLAPCEQGIQMDRQFRRGLQVDVDYDFGVCLIVGPKLFIFMNVHGASLTDGTYKHIATWSAARASRWRTFILHGPAS